MGLLRLTLIAGLVVWLGMGVTYTALGMSRLAAVDDGPAPDEDGVVGMPLGAAGFVSRIRPLLPPPEGVPNGRWLVLLPRGTTPLDRSYVRFQLAHLEYPRRIDVALADSSPPLIRYAGVVAAGRVALPPAWRIVEASAGFRRYEAGRR